MSEFGGLPEGWEPADLDTEESRAVQAALEKFGEEHPLFWDVWTGNVRDAADRACAQVAGQRMAGADRGFIVPSEMAVPVPHGFSPPAVFTVFGLSVLREVSRRLELMTRNGRGGTG